ncbi:MAG: glycosyltransferase [Pseudomonadota bacterium]
MVNVQILMGVYEGAAHLDAQLQSLAEQDHADWCLRTSDDSPTDASRAIIMAFAARVTQQVVVNHGPKQGFAANFMHLFRTGPAGYWALSDQDDVWLPDKLSRALSALERVPKDEPALYCARSIYWDGAARRKPSPPMPRRPTFRNALIENVAQGNTIVLNPAAADLARRAAAQAGAVFAHDWWLYMLVTGAGGQVLVDNGPPVLLYRQHAGNLLGSGHSLRAQVARKLAVMQGAFAKRLDLNLQAMERCRGWLQPDHADLLDAFCAARRLPLPSRLPALAKLRLYRQRQAGTVGFWGAALLGRI